MGPNQPEKLTPAALHKVIAAVTEQMKAASKNLEFEKAAALRDRLGVLRQQLSDMGRDNSLPKELRGPGDSPVTRRKKSRRPVQEKVEPKKSAKSSRSRKQKTK
jgi:excinuclease ABC subunit B